MARRSRADQHLKARDCAEVKFEVLSNDKSKEILEKLVLFKDIVMRRLPLMPVEHITKLVLDKRHRSVIAIRETEILGGICFKPFGEQRFAEIVFVAVNESCKGQGIGAKCMSFVKRMLREEGLSFFVTYADNAAIGFFKKQGFTKKVTMPKSIWKPFIETYTESHLMECLLVENPEEIHVTETTSKRVKQDEEVKSYSWSCDDSAVRIRELMKTGVAKHFLKPVDKKSAPRYYEVVKAPMDLSQVLSKLEASVYSTKEDMQFDLKSIISNARLYYPANSVHVQSASTLEAKLKSMDLLHA